MNTLSIHRPRPSIEMRTPAAVRTSVNRGEVNWLPWSLLKMSGRPNRANASSSAAMQNSTSMEFDKRQLSTRRVDQSITATSIEEAATHRNVGDIRTPDLVRPINHEIAQQIRVHPVR